MNNILDTKLKQHHVIMIVSMTAIIFTIIFGFLLYMPLLRVAIKSVSKVILAKLYCVQPFLKQKALKSGNEMRDFYLKLPIPLDFRIYFFNVTNPLQVQEGQKPILQEVGPYCYE